jgi:hypothetical protein
MTSRTLTQMFLALAALVVLAMSALAADPGLAIPATSAVSDQKAGSVLIYNLYASSSTNPAAQNTRINITNTDDARGVFIHLFFVDGSSCSVADSFICLSKSQTSSILASDVDPDVMGYIVAVAVDASGCPIVFNKLIGDEYVKLSSGHAANLGAEAVAAIGAPACDANSVTATLAFDGAVYNQLPRVLAADNVASAKDGNDTLLVVNRIGGSLLSGASTIGSVFGILYDELESGHSFTFSGGCQLKATLSDSFPRTTPRYTSVVPAGSTGWLKFWATADVAILGSVINKNTQASATSFNGGHNLHKLTTTATATYTIPVFTAMCS